VLTSDVIEHLSKHDGYELICQMEAIAKKRVVIFTPNGMLGQKPEPDNPFQAHLSGWTVSEMRRLGYKVVGVHGFKWFRVGQAQLRAPKAVFKRLSILTQDLAKHLPGLAYQILCYKDM
jgi:hypothetical protein